MQAPTVNKLLTKQTPMVQGSRNFAAPTTIKGKKLTFPNTNTKINKNQTFRGSNTNINEKPLSPVDLMVDKTEQEYYTYLARKIQTNILKADAKTREKEAKQKAVELKLMYEELLKEYYTLRQAVQEANVYVTDIVDLKHVIENAKQVKSVIDDKQMNELLKVMRNNLDFLLNQLQVVGVHEELKKAFETNVLGPESELQAELKKVHNSIAYNKETLALAAHEADKVKLLFDGNESLAVRCDEAASTALVSTRNLLFHAAMKASQASPGPCPMDESTGAMGEPTNTSTPQTGLKPFQV